MMILSNRKRKIKILIGMWNLNVIRATSLRNGNYQIIQHNNNPPFKALGRAIYVHLSIRKLFGFKFRSNILIMKLSFCLKSDKKIFLFPSSDNGEPIFYAVLRRQLMCCVLISDAIDIYCPIFNIFTCLTFGRRNTCSHQKIY